MGNPLKTERPVPVNQYDGIFTPSQVGANLKLRRIGRRIVVLAETTSTNDAAFAAAQEQDADGLAVFADHQTQGRGRQGRRWLSPRGASVLCSVLLIEHTEGHRSPVDPGTLTLAAGIAACDTIAATASDVEPAIRWPNDILIRGRKVAGVLIESRTTSRGRAYVVGIGINCLQHDRHFSDDIRRQATSLEAASHDVIHRLDVARQLLVELDRWLAAPMDTQKVRHAWLDRAEPLGQHIHIRQAGEVFAGTTVDIDPTAGLSVELDVGGRRVFDPATSTLLVPHPLNPKGDRHERA